MNDNPYRVPSDDQVLFQMREEERRMHQQSRARNQSMRVWEKSRKEVLSFSERLREIVGRLVSCIVIETDHDNDCGGDDECSIY